MAIILYLIPLALLIGLIGLAGFFWMVKTDQLDDLEGDARRILMDDDMEGD